MKPLSICVLTFALTLAGCAEKAASPEVAPVDAALGAPAAAPDEAMVAAATGEEHPLTPQNTTIQFVGVHTEPGKPDPRTGQFTAFEGSAIVDGSTLKSIRVDIETESLSTEIEKLTGHLKSADFFNVNEHPQATFVSTKVEEAGDGKVNITGDLTLLGKTQSITFPATVSTDDGLKLNAEFNVDRTAFEMDYGVDKVDKNIAMTISVDG